MLPRVRFPCAARFLHKETHNGCAGGSHSARAASISAAEPSLLLPTTTQPVVAFEGPNARDLRRRLTHAVSRLWIRWVTFREGMPAGLPNNNCSACKLGCSQLQRYHTWYRDALSLLAVLVRAEQRPSRRGYASRRCLLPLSLQLQRTV